VVWQLVRIRVVEYHRYCGCLYHWQHVVAIVDE
jgi:hypothetical protein